MEKRMKFKPTGIIFTLPESEIRRIWAEDGGKNYELIDEIDIPPMEAVPVSTTYEQVVEEHEVRSFYDYTAAELREFCKANDLKASGSKAELLERCLEYTQQLADEQANNEPEVVENVDNSGEDIENQSEEVAEKVEEPEAEEE